MGGGLNNVINVFVYCFVGTYVTEAFLRYAATTYEIHWYKLPIQLQPFALLIIADAQRPCNLTGLGIFDLNLALFSRVVILHTTKNSDLQLNIHHFYAFQIMKAAWSYSVMFRSS